MHLYEMLKQEVESVEKEWLHAKKARTEAENRETTLRAKVTALKNALDAIAPAVPSPVVNTPRSELLAGPNTTNANGHQKNTTEFIRDLIREHASEGITAIEIWQAIQKAKIDISRNYIYAVLNRDAGRDLIVQRQQRYYPKIEAGVQ